MNKIITLFGLIFAIILTTGCQEKQSFSININVHNNSAVEYHYQYVGGQVTCEHSPNIKGEEFNITCK